MQVSIPSDADDGDGDDDEVVCTGYCATNKFIHARHDCLEFPIGASEPQSYCALCWCALCEVPVPECPEWLDHCATTKEQAAERRCAAKAASVQARLSSTPRPPPPAPTSHEAFLRADPRWHAMRHTALRYLEQCGHDLEGAMAAIAATHDVTPGMAQSVLGALEAWGDVITLEGDLWMRPGTDIDEIPPAMLHAAGMAPFPPMLGGPIASQVQMAQRQAAAAALAHALGLQQPFPHGQPPGGR